MWVGVWMLLCHVQPIIKCFFLVPAQHWKKKMSNWFPAKLIFGHFNVIILHLYPRPPSPKHLYSDYSCTLSLQTCQDILSTRKTVFSFSQIYKSPDSFSYNLTHTSPDYTPSQRDHDVIIKEATRWMDCYSLYWPLFGLHLFAFICFNCIKCLLTV